MLKYIQFDNYKCLSGKAFNLNKVNIFTGYNGRGKSSVVQAILMLSQSLRKGDLTSFSSLHVNGEFVELGDFDELLNDPNRYDLSVIMRLANGSDHNVLLGYELGDDYKVGKLSKCIIDDVDYFDIASSMSPNAASDKKEKGGDLRQLPTYLYNQFWHQNLHYVSADRKGPVKFVEKTEVPDFFRVGADGSTTINTISAYKEPISSDMSVQYGDTNEYGLQTAVTMWIDYIMHGGSVSVVGTSQRSEVGQTESKRSAILKLDFGIMSDGKTYPSYNVGFGYSYILPIVVTALIAKRNDIVIIENPEAHLHPEAQTRLTFLLSKLGARGVQLFVETHSEHIINGFRLAALKDDYSLSNDDIRIFFFDYDFKKVDLVIEKTGRIPNWPARFFDQYQTELAEIIRLGAQK